MMKKPLGTLHSIAMADALDTAGVRWAKLPKPSVVGSDPHSSGRRRRLKLIMLGRRPQNPGIAGVRR
jgi:hypothetical protein